MNKKFVAFLAGLLALVFAVCADGSKRAYAVQKDKAWSKNACGAFSMAYYLAETKQIPANKVERVAKKLYEKIKFDPEAGFGDYSDPIKIMDQIAPYVESVSFKMNVSKPATDGEKLLSLLSKGADASILTDIPDFAAALGKDEYAIEILVPRSTVNLQYPMKNPLHYVLTYWKDGALHTLDPGRGREALREDFINGKIESWKFCNGGIFLTPKK